MIGLFRSPGRLVSSLVQKYIVVRGSKGGKLEKEREKERESGWFLFVFGSCIAGKNLCVWLGKEKEMTAREQAAPEGGNVVRAGTDGLELRQIHQLVCGGRKKKKKKKKKKKIMMK